MTHDDALHLLREWKPTWGELRDHMLDRVLGDIGGELPEMSTLNPSIPMMRSFDILDRAVGERDVDQKIDLASSRDSLMAANCVREFGVPTEVYLGERAK